jgi:hypothetical protein
MKKITLVFAFVTMAFSVYSQATAVVTAPQNLTTTQVRAPNGLSTHAYLRAASLVLGSELSAIPLSTPISAFGFTTTAGASSAVTGTMTVYLQNTGDVTYNKGTNWSSIISGMTTVYTGTYTVPANATTIDLTLPTPFTYLGNSVYVAYDFVSNGPFATATPATYGANSALTNGCVSAATGTAGPAPTVLAATNFRPAFRWTYTNSLTNDMSVDLVYGLGTVPAYMGGPFTYEALVKNNSSNALNNVPVTLNITGANTYASTQTISTIASGATATVSYNSWSPLALGAQTVNVSVPSDQNNLNNSKNFLATVTCTVGGFNENPANFNTAVGFNTGSGIIATAVSLPASATVTAVNLAISNNTAAVGNNIYGAILDNAGTILGTTNTLNISSGDLNTKPMFTFTAPVIIPAATAFHIGMAQTPNTTTGYFPVAAYTTPMVSPNIMYNTAALTGGALTPLTTNLGIFGFEPVFMGSCIGLGVNNAALSPVDGLLVYPNPATSTVYVKLASVSEKATVCVYNALGQKVITEKEINGDSAEINVNALPKGVYIVKVTNGKEVSNTKIVVEH